MPTMLTDLRELYRYRDLLRVLVERDLKVRYKRSALGFLWSFINPLMQALVLTLVFKFVLKIQIPNYSAWVLAAILPWTFFQNSVLDAAQSILNHFTLLKKVYFPREIVPLSTVISNLIHLGLSFFVFLIYAWIIRIHIGPMILLLPILVLFHFLLNAGIALAVSAMNVYYEDVKFIVQVFVQLLFYVCPIIYPTSRIVAEGGDPFSPMSLLFLKLYLLNPMASLIFAYQKILLSRAAQLDPRPLDFGLLCITFLQCLLIAAWGYWFFNKRKWEFAERL
ncbi:MAG: ABC transporter permease [Armatimonadetes bacterium]|nr:ABC transporter permease [Armatimonadota bacterium]